ncbi:GntR family transcriptional regulator [Murinocardiopsis flavida]|uniref:GntR family transcriptional regulator n=1 Tax=Murinocardiopsis flavida TaxID=645275 RepID=A0A2P8CMK8_9ACTN|nr:GntR family transcriptional regulator [Murinocardiopsis flavida]PSK86204.1 GntR family transcriptional regulator [Murinocardiopsis flavida]
MPAQPSYRPGKVARPVPLREAAYEALLDQIITRELPPGRHLVESDIAEVLGVSRQPVREALQKLNNEGWVDLRPGHGAYVHTPSESEADQLLAVRAVLETESARLAAQCAGSEELDRLRELCGAGVAAVESDDVERVVAANAEFHRGLTEVSGNRVLSELAAQVDRRVRWYYAPVARVRGLSSWDEHARIVGAIAEGAEGRAAALMREHTERTRLTYHDLVGTAPGG